MRFVEGPRGGSSWRKGRCRADHCRRVGPVYKNGLTLFCWMKLQAAGKLDRYPPLRVHRRADDVLDEWYVLAGRPPEGTTTAELASRMGMNLDALQRALARARKAGDPRAIYLPDPLTGIRHDPARASSYRQRRKPSGKGGQS